MATHHPIRKTVTPEIPDKLYFRIGDVARICEVPAYVLRFWETEFPQLKPNKGGTGQRLYRRRDVEMALRIKSLLYDQGYTIPGARQVFKSESRHEPKAEPKPEPRLEAKPEPWPEPRLEARPAAAITRMPGAPEITAPAAPAENPARTAQLHALRDELRELHALLEAAPGAYVPPPAPVPARPRLQPIRPRLATFEPKRSSEPKLPLEGDLF